MPFARMWKNNILIRYLPYECDSSNYGVRKLVISVMYTSLAKFTDIFLQANTKWHQLDNEAIG